MEKKSAVTNPIARLFIPQYDELVIFLMSISSILVISAYPDLRAAIVKVGTNDPRVYIFIFILFCTVLYSIYHVFTTDKKSKAGKENMLFFAVIVSGISGIAAGIHAINDSTGLLIIFPIWNIANGFILLSIARLGLLDHSNISDNDASLPQVLLGSVVVIFTFAICKYLYELYWAITFSICVVYAVNIDQFIQKLLSIRIKSG